MAEKRRNSFASDVFRAPGNRQPAADDEVLGDTVSRRSAFQLSGNAVDVVSGIIKAGVEAKMSTRSIGRYTQRAMEAFSQIGKGDTSGLHTSPRSFSSQPLLSSMNDKGISGFEQRLRESTNSFFKGETGWWDSATASKGKAGVSWSAANDPGLGAGTKNGYNFRTDPGLGPTPSVKKIPLPTQDQYAEPFSPERRSASLLKAYSGGLGLGGTLLDEAVGFLSSVSLADRAESMWSGFAMPASKTRTDYPMPTGMLDDWRK